jgi:hypothetical protein
MGFAKESFSVKAVKYERRDSSLKSMSLGMGFGNIYGIKKQGDLRHGEKGV